MTVSVRLAFLPLFLVSLTAVSNVPGFAFPRKESSMPKRAASETRLASSDVPSKKQTQSSMTGFFTVKNPTTPMSVAKTPSEGGGSKTQLSATAGAAMMPSSPQFKIFCDLDGVLCDFEAGVKKICNGKSPDDLDKPQLWGSISRADAFYEKLPWTRDGRKLWDTIRHMTPDILTGVPSNKRSRREKAMWCQRELGVPVNHVDMAGTKSAHQIVQGRKRKGVTNVITCWSRNKHFESGHKAVLIDDRIALAEDWEAKGGIFVHHTDTERTLEHLKSIGVLADTLEMEEKVHSLSPTFERAYDMPPDTP